MFNFLFAFASFSVTEAGGHTSGDAEMTPVTELLKGAIHRGVPMYNSGQHEACAMIYETALHALVLGEWDLSENEVGNMKPRFEEAMAMDSPTNQAWAYRHIMDDLMTSQKMKSMMDDETEDEPETAPTPANMNKMVLFNFNEPDDYMDWDVILDGVMGGLSTGHVKTRGGKMLFHGATSLANNGGFSSIRAQIEPGSLAGMSMLRMRVKGDGRTYILGTKGADQFSYWHTFETEKGKWITVDAPIREMEKHWFGYKRPGTIMPNQVRAIEFFINDKKAGPYKLRVDFIKAMK